MGPPTVCGLTDSDYGFGIAPRAPVLVARGVAGGLQSWGLRTQGAYIGADDGLPCLGDELASWGPRSLGIYNSGACKLRADGLCNLGE